MSAKRFGKKEKSYRNYKETGDNEDKIAWKRNRTVSTRIFRIAKQTSWREYVCGLNTGAKSAEIWKTVNKRRGKNSREFNIMRRRNEMITEYDKIAELMADTFASVTTEANYHQQFITWKRQGE